MMHDVVVVGAGPAGLVAAAQSARAGAATLLLDERAAPGGQLRDRAQPVATGHEGTLERPDRLLARLLGEILAAGVELRTGALVAGCFAQNALLVVEGDRSSHLSPEAVVVTTGAADLPYPFSGATFPGVFSARGLQILLHQHRVRPGRRFAVIGGGGEAAELVADIRFAGGEVVWSGIAPASFLRAEGAAGVRRLVVGQDRYDVEIVAVAVGRQPDPALAAMAGVPLGFVAELGGLVPMIDHQVQSSVPGLFVAGDAAGVGSVATAMAEGRLAGVATAHSLGLAREADVGAARAAGGAELAWRIAKRESLNAVASHPYE